MNEKMARLATALIQDYVSVYYLNLNTGKYEGYRVNQIAQNLELQASGENFFSDFQREIQNIIWEDDQKKMQAYMTRESLREKLQNQNELNVIYRVNEDGKPVYNSLRILRDLAGEEGSLILGILNIDEQMRKELATQTYNDIASSLANQYGMIYYINVETDEYIEFSVSDKYEGLKISPTGSDFFGTSQRNISIIVHPNDRERVFQALDKKTMLKTLQENGSFTISYQLQLNQSNNYTRMSVFWAKDKKHLIMAVMDIDNEIQKENEFKKMMEDNAVFFQIAESLAKQYDTIYYVDMLNDHFVEFSSTDVYKSLNVPTSGDDYFTQSANDLHRVIYQDDQDGLRRFLDKKSLIQALKTQHMPTHTYRINTGNGIMYARMSVIWATDNKHLIIGVMNIDKEIRHEREIQAKLVAANEKAYRDDLTGVKNKSAYTDYVEQLQQSIDQKNVSDFALLVCDVNGLKEVNDNLGHIEGDIYIQSASHLICHVWDHSPVFRIGGDEFVVLIRGEDYKNREQLLTKMREQILSNKQHGKVTIAIGISDYNPAEDTTVAQVFDRADNQMYENKAWLKQEA